MERKKWKGIQPKYNNPSTILYVSLFQQTFNEPCTEQCSNHME